MIVLRDGLDVVGIRQALSMSLLTLKPFSAGVGRLGEDPVASRILQGLGEAARCMKLGHLELDGDIAIFHPEKLTWGHYTFDAGTVMPVAEVVLMLMPVLSRQPYRSSLTIKGVTHSHHTQTTDCIRETLLGMLERFGVYAYFSLKRFGFNGTGRGHVESKIYPLEKRVCEDVLTLTKAEITSARVYAAKLPTEYAVRQKEVLAEEARIPAEKIGIMEIIDTDGPGSFMQVHIDCGHMVMIVDETCPLYEMDGSYIFDGTQAELHARGLARRVRDFIAAPVVSDALVREVVPYSILCGCDINRLAAAGDGSMMASDIAGNFL